MIEDHNKPQRGEMTKFQVGDYVIKNSGYTFIGTVVSVFSKMNGEIRYVVELEGMGLLHIFSEEQLNLCGLRQRLSQNPNDIPVRSTERDKVSKYQMRPEAECIK